MIKNAEVQKHMFKILVVEDDKELNRTVCAYLNQNGYNAVGCRSADEAYDEFYGGEKFDMIISDIMMPGTDGHEFAKTIRTQNPDIPILLMTHFSMSATFLFLIRLCSILRHLHKQKAS